jgi:hypothetical protein
MSPSCSETVSSSCSPRATVSVICVKNTCALISYERGKKDLIVISANGICYTDQNSWVPRFLIEQELLTVSEQLGSPGF